MTDSSRVETQHLLDLARDKSVVARQALAATVTDLFFTRGGVLTDRERSLMTEILRQLINDVESTVRRALAERLAHLDNSPHDLVVALANDEITVAHAILMHSDVLRDEELVEIIHHRTLEHQLAVAMRKSLSETVSDALVETGAADVIKTLLENHNAKISAAALEYLVEQSQAVDTYQNPLLRRPDLNSDLARRMYWWVSAALRQHILDNFPINPSDVDDALEASVGDLATPPIRQQSRKSLELAESLARAEAISPELLVRSLRQGEIALFEAMFVKLTGIPPTLVRRLVFERGGEGLAVACRAIGIATPIFASIFVLSRKARPNDAPPARGEIKRILDFYENMSLAAATQLIKTWRRDKDFLKAIWQLDKPGSRRAAS